ncbi:hypothetical protein K7I13_03920 [Brucepastera parasyntrophica]|uniref:anaerobic ribonucleoside-triphosphate reductase n=1 Tax=Brucepastera parasyntrophica TaxID=2880008 RepID=UPI00210939D5|nr:anaerobic ribonucleoside-triphosphate reductase [Brucepastera parasyntrophica]ULQ60467.1 hypothetical protein K7I13_03920 [Brucepastera parasyntrophica]
MKHDQSINEENTVRQKSGGCTTAGKGTGFERIRRITGYLVGTMDKWNDAKKAEEAERVKHNLS